MFVKLKDWDERGGKGQDVRSIAQRAGGFFATHPRRARSFAVVPPAVLELGNASRLRPACCRTAAALATRRLLAARNQLLGMAAQNPLLAGVRPNGVEDAPQFKLDIDREKASALGVSLADINQTLSDRPGRSTYVNDFLDRGRVKRVYVQGEAGGAHAARGPGNRWYVRNAQGEMVPFSAFASGELDLWSAEADALQRRASVQHPGRRRRPGTAPARRWT